MGWLAASGRHAITAADLVAARNGERPLPSKPVMITFDDAFRGAACRASPVLARHGFRAHIYLVAGLPGEMSRWMVSEVGVELPLIDWSEARELEKAGWVCGSHTVTHPRLTRIPLDECRRELRDSRRFLEDALGHSVTDLAYPFGFHDDSVVAAAGEAGYRTACTTREGFSTDEPLLSLRRLSVSGADSIVDFRLRVLTGHSPREWWAKLQESLRGAR
jgi:peptidoglycan/xylan/chitin deacetylase (PgdA/CDA1 family)